MTNEFSFTVAALHGNKKCTFITKDGVEGAKHNNPDRPVSLISLDARQKVDQAQRRGLCYRRFTADITLDCTEMPAKGSQLSSGDLVLRILPEGKTCFPECELVQENLPCPLREGVRFASVELPGRLCLGDKFLF